MRNSKIKKNGGSLLDVGAGVGDFLKILKSATRYSLFGVDLMASKVEGVEWFVQDLNRHLQFKNGRFGVVTCIEVLEHVENPRQLVREIFRVMEAGGTAVITTPNNQSWRAILSYIFREHFVAFTDSSYPAHITALNRADLERMCREAGFVNIEIEYTDSGVVPKLTSLTWQGISRRFFKGMRYSDNVICIAQKPAAPASV